MSKKRLLWSSSLGYNFLKCLNNKNRSIFRGWRLWLRHCQRNAFAQSWVRSALKLFSSKWCLWSCLSAVFPKFFFLWSRSVLSNMCSQSTQDAQLSTLKSGLDGFAATESTQATVEVVLLGCQKGLNLDFGDAQVAATGTSVQTVWSQIC